MWHPKQRFTLVDTIRGWLVGESRPRNEGWVIEVRLRIIKTLKQCRVDEGEVLMHRVAQAPEMEDLWYLRPNILQALSSQHGEVRAIRIMARQITPLFAGSLSTELFRAPSAWRAKYASRRAAQSPQRSA